MSAQTVANVRPYARLVRHSTRITVLNTSHSDPSRRAPGQQGESAIAAEVTLTALDMNDQTNMELPGDATDVVGWAIRSPLRSHTTLPSDRARDLLATALGLRHDRLASLSDGEIATAVERLRGLVDQCRRLAAEVAVDDLTGALRRGAGLAALQREIDRSRRTQTPIVVAFVDADGLKRVNDTMGHAAGDRFLREVVSVLRERLRSYDLVVRYGGDEFFCVLTNADLAVAERLVAEVRANVTTRTDGHSVSIGLTEVRDGDSAESVVARADTELYAGRRAAARG